MKTRIGTLIALCALLGAMTALVLATGEDPAEGARKGQLVRLGKGGKLPLGVLPKVPRARNADRLGGRRARGFRGGCNEISVDLGSWCLYSNPYPLTQDEVGKNDFFFATKTCAAIGGYLPSAAELIGAADRVKLASVITDNPVTASIDEDRTDGLKDRREMSSTLVTTASGSRSSGSQGVSEGSLGDPRQGEPNPVPQSANPYPETLQYVTVYDNSENGGFAGSKPVSQPEAFRCAFHKTESRPGGE